MGLVEKEQLMDQKEIRRALTRLASEILERNQGVKDMMLVGIRTGGMHLAYRLEKMITKMEGEKPEVGVIDITLYRDDVFSLEQPEVGETEIETEVDGKHIILIDDVIYTGRTIRAAMDAVIDFGRPANIQLAVLVDRGLREFPIHPDYVGRKVDTQKSCRVEVRLKETGEEKDRAVLYSITKGEK